MVAETIEALYALRKANEILEKVFSTTHLHMAYLDRDFNFLRVNRAYANGVGREPEYFIGKNHFELFPYAGNEAIFRKVVETGKPHTEHARPFAYTEAPGVVTYWDWTLEPVKDPTGEVTNLILTLLDVTERKRSERARKESERALSTLMDNIPGMVYRCRNDRDWTVEVASDGCRALTGYKASEFLSGEVSFGADVIHPDDQKMVWEKVQEAVEKQRPFKLEYRIVTKKGAERWVWEHGRGVYSETGELLALEGLIADVTERKLAEEDLTKYKLLVDNISDLAYICDTSGNILYVNSVFEKLTGQSPGEFTGRPFAPLFEGKDLERAKDVYLRTINGEHPAYELRFKGTGVLCEYKNLPFRDKHGNIIGVIGTARDITEKKKVEAELEKAARLESLGVLAGGIAHDFNNILTGVLGNVSIAKNLVAPGDRVYESLEATEKASVMAKGLTKQLLTFAKGGAPVKAAASVEGLLKDCCSFSVCGSNVRCDLSVGAGLLPADIDAGQISQVINNLVINAQQAMPGGGVIQVRAENATVGKGANDRLPLEEGRYVKVTVRDHGEGIPEEDLKRIFDPFFTTKDTGSGLGLAVSYSIVKNHGGHIMVESGHGAGTTFEVYLPVSDRPIPDVSASKETPVNGSGKVLAMDDEEVVRDVLASMLSSLGYEADIVTDGVDAVRLFDEARKLGKPYDAVILDLTVPGGLGGIDTVKMIKEIDPSARAIVSSGYSSDTVMAEFRSKGFSAVISKPYTVKEFSTVLKSVMNKG